jgi:hypothetical protein
MNATSVDRECDAAAFDVEKHCGSQQRTLPILPTRSLGLPGVIVSTIVRSGATIASFD